MNDFIKYWDDVLAYWVLNGSVPPQESFWDFKKIGLLPELMPEPYLGDPENCSVLILNYNPGAPDYDVASEEYKQDTAHHSQLDNPDKMVFHYAHNYRERMKNGGYVGRDTDPLYNSSNLHPAGKKWWSKRLDWIKELIPESTKNPFALDLCAWHSHEWANVKYDKELLAELKQRLAPVIEETIQKSDLGIGICIGAAWGSQVLPAFGYQDVTAEIMNLTDYRRGWKPLEGSRSYAILRNSNNTYIINSWKTGFRNMDVPAPEYREIEKDMIKRIKVAKS